MKKNGMKLKGALYKPNKLPFIFRDKQGKNWILTPDLLLMDPGAWFPLPSESPGNAILASRWNNVLTAIQSLTDSHRHDGTDSMTLGASAIASGDLATARMQANVLAAIIAAGGIVDADVAAAAAIAWSKISKTGSSLADLATRSAADLSSGDLASARMQANVLAAILAAGGITNTQVAAAAAIAYSKLALSNSIVNADINSAAAIAYSKLALSNSIVNADINSAAAIAKSKISSTGAWTAAEIPDLDVAKITTGRFGLARLPTGTDEYFLRGNGAADPVYEAIPFSCGGTILYPSGAINVIAWRAPFACTVTNVRGYRVGGTGATVNARLNGASNHLASNLSLTSADAWMDGGTVQNTAYVAGDKLEIMIVSISGAPTQVAVQVEFTRP
jgi:hypothetical protein